MPENIHLVNAKAIAIRIINLLEDPKQDEKKKIFIVKLLAIRLAKEVETTEGCPQNVNWLQNWDPIDFTGMTPSQVAAHKMMIQMNVTHWLAKLDADAGTVHTISFVWSPVGQNREVLQAFLCPEALVVIEPGGPGGGSMNPQDPPKP